jgi:hypothetical protein
MPPSAPRPHLLRGRPDLPSAVRDRLAADFRRFADAGLPADVEAYLRDAYGLDVSGSYAGRPLRNPWGKASGQLSMTVGQVEEAIAAGLGFVVLKTVIAEDPRGGRSMAAWAIPESRMVPEPIVGRDSGATGWTITWKGRGWWRPFADYLELVRQSIALGHSHGLLVVPSVKYHLPAPGEPSWRVEEYAHTTRLLLDAHADAEGTATVMPLEKDFSPTLAGSDRASAQAMILDWLARVPPLIRAGASPRPIAVGLKLFNALFDDPFQLAMLRVVHGPDRPDFLVYANRLFDPSRTFEGHRGVAFGGPDLSDRNLRVLSALRSSQSEGAIPRPSPELSATGDIASGRLAVEYALRGATSFQLHTLFQLPASAYPMPRGTKLQKALHLLTFDPDEGLVAWLLHASHRLGIAPRLLDLAARGATSDPKDLDSALRPS